MLLEVDVRVGGREDALGFITLKRHDAGGMWTLGHCAAWVWSLGRAGSSAHKSLPEVLPFPPLEYGSPHLVTLPLPLLFQTRNKKSEAENDARSSHSICSQALPAEPIT